MTHLTIRVRRLAEHRGCPVVSRSAACNADWRWPDLGGSRSTSEVAWRQSRSPDRPPRLHCGSGTGTTGNPAARIGIDQQRTGADTDGCRRPTPATDLPLAQPQLDDALGFIAPHRARAQADLACLECLQCTASSSWYARAVFCGNQVDLRQHFDRSTAGNVARIPGSGVATTYVPVSYGLKSMMRHGFGPRMALLGSPSVRADRRCSQGDAPASASAPARRWRTRAEASCAWLRIAARICRAGCSSG